MTTPLLTTKLYIPLVRLELVSRPRLIERLNEGLLGQSGRFARKLTLISAPAGFGKTTLLAEWLSQLTIDNYQLTIDNYRAAWLSLDEDDNDPVRFFTYFIAALGTIQADLGTEARALLQSPQSPPLKAALTTLINDLTSVPADPSTSPSEIGQAPSTLPLSGGTGHGFVLVLDDYHVIEQEAIHDSLAFLLDHQPPQMHLVIASRADPPLPLARLRTRGQLTELRAADLRFTSDEAITFLNQVMGLDLSTEDIAALEARTEGWIAGLQLAALSMRGKAAEHVADFIAAFSGSHRHVIDYLAEEVLAQQSGGIQSFLCQTAILDRLTASLCNAVTGREDGDAVLRQLEQANLFLVPLDDRRRWYRYHHLFADFLRSRLGQSQPDQVQALHRRASEWYEHQATSLGDDTLMAEAIDHALSARDFERAARLIEQTAEATLMRSEVATFLGWVEKLPDEVIRAWPSLCLYHAGVLLVAGRPLDAIESRLQDMEGDTDAHLASAAISGKVAAVRALIAAFQGQMSRATELSHQALEQLPEDALFLRGIVAMNLSIPYVWNGEVVAAGHAWAEVARISQQAGNILVAVVAMCQQAEQHIMEGQLHRAAAIYRHVLELASDREGKPRPIAGLAMIGLAEVQREWNDLEGAARHLEKGIALIKQWGEIGSLDGYITLARVRQAQADVSGACEAIQKAQQLAVKFDASEIDDILVAVHQARLWVAQGDIEAAARWIEERGLQAETSLVDLEKKGDSVPSYYLHELEQIALARVCIAQGKPDRALMVLRSLLPAAERRKRMGSVIEISALQALAFNMQNDAEQALLALERALSLAKLESYVRIFVDEGEPMIALLRQAAAQGISVDYVSKLSSAFLDSRLTKAQTSGFQPFDFAQGKSPISNLQSPVSNLTEPLSERELEVLRLIVAGLSNREIAEKLVIAISTVKTHINNIYRKLNVPSRTQAAARARELNLV